MSGAAKVGMLPYVVMPDGSYRFMIYQPKNKNPHDPVQPFQLARGTPEPEDEGNPLCTAKREAWEELAIYDHEVLRWKDAGVHDYKDYQIHFFLAQLGECVLRQPEDALGTRWVSVAELSNMVMFGNFKRSYLLIFDAILSKI